MKKFVAGATLIGVVLSTATAHAVIPLWHLGLVWGWPPAGWY